MWMAIFHVVGALAASFAFGILALVIGAWEEERIKKRRLQDVSIALGVPIAALENKEEIVPSLIQYSAQRYSGELLRNRVSDFCGLLRTAWGWLSTVVQVGIVGGVSWSIFTNGAESAALMWLVPAASLFFWFASIAFSFACLLLTGRYPSEAKLARKSIAAFIEQRDSLTAKAAPAWES